MAKLLLVEDDNNLREIYEARLQAEGYTIVSAKDGEEALVIAKAEKPDLVVADVMMPKISGFEMLDIMRNTDGLKDVKVIMLTALGQSDDQERASKLKADRYLVKSQVTLEDIVKVVHELLGDQAGPGDKPDTGASSDKPANTAATDDKPAADADKPTADADKPAPDPVTAPDPEPVPAPSPDSTPAPDPVPAPAPTPTPSASATDSVAKSTVQEEADVEAKIEDFVAGASSEPTTPGNAPSAAPDTTPVKPEGDGASNTTDDKLMADAVETLVASTDDKDKAADATAASAPTTTTIPVSTASDDDASKDATPEPKKENKAGGGSVNSEKIIVPPESKPKKDINELLAIEEAKSAQTTPGTTITIDSGDGEDKASGEPPAAPGSTPPTGSKAAATNEPGASPDPSSIAL